jgi:putative hydrolase of the HAD superfamily
VFFDVDDTLVEWTVSWRHAFADAAREVGVEVSAERAFDAVMNAFSTYYDDCLAEHAASGDELAFWFHYDGRILADLGLPADRVREATEHVIDLLEGPQAIRLYDEVPEVLSALAARGIPLGIVTGRPKAEPDLSTLGVQHYFHPVIDAFSVGSSKSAGRMFIVAAEAAAEAGLPAWHVGDNYDDDVLGARAAGIRPVLIDRKGVHTAADCPRISDLRELIPIVLNGEP